MPELVTYGTGYWFETAQRLERELAAAKAECAELKAEVERMRKERDERHNLIVGAIHAK